MMHENLQVIQTMLRSIHQMLGDRYEVILHDLSHVESSIVGIEGCITHRKIGGPATNYLIQLLREYGDEAKDCINYKNVMPDGRVLRSSTIFIRDNDGKIIGSLCINQDLTDFMVANRLLERLVEFKSEEHEVPKEMFAQDISEVMEAMVGSELALMNKPVAYMQKEDKLALVDDLERKGVFDVKGSVEYVAECLGVTTLLFIII